MQKLNITISVLIGCATGFALAMAVQFVTDKSGQRADESAVILAENHMLSKESEELRHDLAVLEKETKGLRFELEKIIAGNIEGSTSTRREDLLESRLQLAREKNKKLKDLNDSIRKSQSDPLSSGSLAAFKKLEDTISSAPNWSQLNRNEPEKKRLYGHTTGLRAEFWEMNDGTGRMRLTWHPLDKVQNDMASSVWLLIPALGGPDNAVHEANTKKMLDWFDSPTDILLLEGAVIYEKVEGHERQMNLYCPS